MNPEQLADIEAQIGECILNIFKSEKIKPSDVTKVEMGLKYLKTITGMNYQKFSGLIQFAGLYSTEHREDIAKNIILPRFQLCGDVTTDPSEIKGVFEDLKTYRLKAENLEQELVKEKQKKDILEQEAERKIQAERNKVEDLKDELELKGKKLLQEIAKEEYKLKRDL